MTDKCSECNNGLCPDGTCPCCDFDDYMILEEKEND